MRILITGGAGFVGSNLARLFKTQTPSAEIIVLDNLRRRGSEINLPLLKTRGIAFHHGDIRQPSDLDDLPGNFDLLIEASAEPSVHAGLDGSPQYVLQTNLLGTLNCLEFARRRAQTLVFLSTSRVYSIEALRGLDLVEAPTRFELAEQAQSGSSTRGVAENFSTQTARSFYGATKLASEMMIQEYAHSYGLRAVINRCGVICGPGQFGKLDQGVFTLWVAAHLWNKSLRYTGFGGEGKQVRDLLHPEDLFALLVKQIENSSAPSAEIYNVGGGVENSVSLQELTALCRKVTNNEIEIGSDITTATFDVPLYISDNAKVSQRFDWAPQRSVESIVEDIACWLRENETQLRPLFM